MKRLTCGPIPVDVRARGIDVLAIYPFLRARWSLGPRSDAFRFPAPFGRRTGLGSRSVLAAACFYLEPPLLGPPPAHKLERLDLMVCISQVPQLSFHEGGESNLASRLGGFPVKWIGSTRLLWFFSGLWRFRNRSTKKTPGRVAFSVAIGRLPRSGSEGKA